ncbi:meiotic recombination protein DMC1 [Microdochium trichocladiopsis]|uniref:Meiotic recombination protein DMC1 n=1 Tax=Microdochium trichocladiopsis TaxID=1682393 RepID=A0A9P8XZB8_9PEZI|nr:meiotic recombination protein DMC1 [Microdochium trichocladiopsis]KAH7025939.1 meiotic recombination protein DMC1 [Microdochium trichocladiopsis]
MADKSSEDGFSVLPVAMPPLPAFPVQTTHHVYLRRNTPKIPSPDDSRSLFLANVPVDSTEAHFRALFASLVGAGRFEGVTFERDRATQHSTTSHEPAQAARIAAHLQKKRKREDEERQNLRDAMAAELPETWARPLHRSGSTAVALLVDEKSVEAVLKAIRKLNKAKKYPLWGEGVKADKVAPLGSQWLKAHNKLSYPGTEAVQAAVDAYFTLFNRREAEAEQLAKRLRNEPDEDGFVTVTRGGRNAPARMDEAEEAKKRMLERAQKKKDETQDFYRFQMRERRKAEQADLLRRFADDKRKVEAMREKRGKFKPET